jgi:DNA-binding CsgD family transcriptional regulator
MDSGDATTSSAIRVATKEDVRALLRRWVQEGWIEGRVEVADEIFTSDVALHFPMGDAQGTAMLKTSAAAVRELADLACSYDLTGMDGDHFLVTIVIRGRHIKPYFGAPPNGRTLESTNFATVRMRGLQVAELWQTATSRYLDEPDADAGRTLQPGWAEEWQLTPRERDVAALLMKGYPDKQVAAELDLAVATVRKHVARILAKSGSPSRTRLAEHAGLVRLG